MIGFAVRNDGQGSRAVNGPDDVRADEWYTDGVPPDPAPLPPTTQELVARAKAQRDQLLSVAANRMGPLQDAVDTKQATNDEVARLVQWKDYRIILNRIEQQEFFPVEIQWPVSPDTAA